MLVNNLFGIGSITQKRTPSRQNCPTCVIFTQHIDRLSCCFVHIALDTAKEKNYYLIMIKE